VVGQVLFFLVASGCSQHQLAPKDIRRFYNSDLTRVEGLRSVLKRSPDAPVRVLLLHGMLTNQAGYSARLQREIIAKLGLGLIEGETLVGPIERGYGVTVFDGPQPLSSNVKIPLSSLTRRSWLDPNDRRERIVLYEVLWAPPRDVVKNRFLACFEAGVQADECEPPALIRPNPDRQAFLNRFAKNGLLVGGFADASIVLSPVGDVLRDDIRLAMCVLAADVMGRNLLRAKHPSRCDLVSIVAGRYSAQETNERLRVTPFFAITHSLGSFLLLDGQIRFAVARANTQEDVMREMAAFHLLDQKTVFMRANQISLLHLARLQVACDEEPCPNRLLPRVEDIWNAPPELSQMTTYVAFNDKNDILGFELPPYLAERNVVGELVNVSVRNPGFSLPFVLKDPLAAHLKSDRNPAVIKAIVEGFALPPPTQQ
jgi:hypothetical protein